MGEEAVTDKEFERLVADAIDELPEFVLEALANVPIVISNDGHEWHAYGLYNGDGIARDNYPDNIKIFKDTLVRDFGSDPDRLREEVRQTLRHEIAHHFGWGEEGVQKLGL